MKSTRISGPMFDGIKKSLENVSFDAHLVTDQAKYYVGVGKQFASPETVNHSSKEWTRGSVSHIGDLQSHTAKSKSREAYEQIVELLREIDYMWHISSDYP